MASDLFGSTKSSKFKFPQVKLNVDKYTGEIKREPVVLRPGTNEPFRNKKEIDQAIDPQNERPGQISHARGIFTDFLIKYSIPIGATPLELKCVRDIRPDIWNFECSEETCALSIPSLNNILKHTCTQIQSQIKEVGPQNIPTQEEIQSSMLEDSFAWAAPVASLLFSLSENEVEFIFNREREKRKSLNHQVSHIRSEHPELGQYIVRIEALIRMAFPINTILHRALWGEWVPNNRSRSRPIYYDRKWSPEASTRLVDLTAATFLVGTNIEDETLALVSIHREALWRSMLRFLPSTPEWRKLPDRLKRFSQRPTQMEDAVRMDQGTLKELIVNVLECIQDIEEMESMLSSTYTPQFMKEASRRAQLLSFWRSHLSGLKQKLHGVLRTKRNQRTEREKIVERAKRIQNRRFKSHLEEQRERTRNFSDHFRSLPGHRDDVANRLARNSDDGIKSVISSA